MRVHGGKRELGWMLTRYSFDRLSSEPMKLAGVRFVSLSAREL